MSRGFQALVFAVVIVMAALGLSRESRAGGPVIIGKAANSGSASSAVGGAHAGYNWQSGATVFGFETDFSGTNLNTSMQAPLVGGGLVVPPPGGTSTSATINWFGTARGRLGVTSGPLLFYVTGGFAYGNVDLSSHVQTDGGVPLNSAVSSLKTGWVAGGGIGYTLRTDLFLTLGYQYVDLGTLSLMAKQPSGFGPILSQTASADARFQTIMAALSWRFAPSGSGSWAGGYVGGQVGGAWGLPTSASYSSSPGI